jgi:hypothetical protein
MGVSLSVITLVEQSLGHNCACHLDCGALTQQASQLGHGKPFTHMINTQNVKNPHQRTAPSLVRTTIGARRWRP